MVEGGLPADPALTSGSMVAFLYAQRDLLTICNRARNWCASPFSG